MEFPWLPGAQIYHAVRTLPYVAAYALTPDENVPLIRQYRPAVEKFTWELPAGVIDDEVSPETICRRELEEETGLIAEEVTSLGVFDIDTGRAERSQHLFLAHCSDPSPDFQPEPGTEVAYLPEDDLENWIRSGRISSLPHIGGIHIAQAFRQRG